MANPHDCYRFKVTSFADLGLNRFYVADCSDCGRRHQFGEIIEERFEVDREYTEGCVHHAQVCGYHD